jgi:4-amino-4-deoxy-L-arabinose transferase-like glycosyltransferase
MKDPAFRNKIIIIILIITAAFCIRLYNINGALFDFNPLRQALNAFVARNYAQNPDSAFLLPQADNAGPAPGYLMFELQMVAYAVSFLIKAIGIQNWIFRLPYIILFMLSSVYFYKICTRILDFRTSAIALVFYCITPMTLLMSRVFQSEGFIMFALLFSIYYFMEWINQEKIRHLFLCTIGLTILILLKIPNLYIFLFIGSLFFIYKKPKLIPYFILPAIIILLINYWWWIYYPAKIRMMFPDGYTFPEGNVSIFTTKYILDTVRQYSFSPKYWSMTIKQCFWVVFSPLICILFFIGIFVKKKMKTALILFAWLGSVLFFLFIIPSTAKQDYYKIQLIPVGAILAAICYFWIFDKIELAWIKRSAVGIFWVLVILNIFVIVYPVIRYKPIFEQQQVLGKKVEEISQQGDLVIASFGPDPMLLFYCNRKGWSQYLSSEDDNIHILEQKRKKGAKYFVCGNLDEFEYDPQFKQYMFEHYKLLSEGSREYLTPKKYSLDYFIWAFLGKLDYSFSKNIRAKLERASLGHVIFDLRRKL